MPNTTEPLLKTLCRNCLENLKYPRQSLMSYLLQPMTTIARNLDSTQSTLLNKAQEFMMFQLEMPRVLHLPHLLSLTQRTKSMLLDFKSSKSMVVSSATIQHCMLTRLPLFSMRRRKWEFYPWELGKIHSIMSIASMTSTSFPIYFIRVNLWWTWTHILQTITFNSSLPPRRDLKTTYASKKLQRFQWMTSGKTILTYLLILPRLYTMRIKLRLKPWFPQSLMRNTRNDMLLIFYMINHNAQLFIKI